MQLERHMGASSKLMVGSCGPGQRRLLPPATSREAGGLGAFPGASSAPSCSERRLMSRRHLFVPPFPSHPAQLHAPCCRPLTGGIQQGEHPGRRRCVETPPLGRGGLSIALLLALLLLLLPLRLLDELLQLVGAEPKLLSHGPSPTARRAPTPNRR